MTAFYVNTLSTTGLILSSGDSLLVAGTGTFFTSSVAVSMNGSSSVTLLGSMYSFASSTLRADVSFGRVVIGETGFLGGFSGNSPIDVGLTGADARFDLVNAGTIVNNAAPSAMSLFFSAAAFQTISIVNDGLLTSNSNGIQATFASAGHRLDILNTGTLAATDTAILTSVPLRLSMREPFGQHPAP